MSEPVKQEELVFNPEFLEIDDSGGGVDSSQVIPKKEDKKQELNLFNDNVLEQSNLDVKTVEFSGEEILDKGSLPPDNINKKDSSLFSVVLGQDLMGEGALSIFNEEEVTKIAKDEGDASAIKYMIQKQFEENDAQIKSTYDKGYQDYLDLVQGGVPKQEAAGILGVENFVNAVKQIDLMGEADDAVQARKDLLTLNYRLTTKWSDDKINSYVNKLYNEGSDLEEVDDALKIVDEYVVTEKASKIEQAKQAEVQSKAAQVKQLTDLKNYIDKSEEFFKGDKITKLVKDKMLKSVTTPVKLQNGVVTSQLWAKREENPVSFDSKIAYLDAIGYFDEKPLDKFITNAETKATSKLQSFLQDNGSRSYKGSLERSFNTSGGGGKDPLADVLFK